MSKFFSDRRRAIQLFAAASAGLVVAPTLARSAPTPAAEKVDTAPPTQIHYRTTSIDGLDIFYREAGPADAPVILLMHGWPSSSRMFQNLIPELATSYRVIAPDYPGFGHSSAPDRSVFAYTFDNIGAVMESLLERLQIKEFVLYNMDIGGPVGYRLMLKEPHRMTALVVQNGPTYPVTDVPWWGVMKNYMKDGTQESREKVRSYLSEESISQQHLFGVKDPSLINPDSWLIDVALLKRPGSDEASLDLLYDIRKGGPTFAAAREYFRKNLPPTLVVSGANDQIFPADNQKQYLTDLPNAEIHLLDTGHYALDDKALEIGALMKDFLQRKLPSRG